MTDVKQSGSRKPHHGSRLDDFLADEGVLEQFQAVAIKEVIAWQIAQAMADRQLSKSKMAQLMNTSRAQLDRLLDKDAGNVTLETLQRAASVLGRTIRVELV
jgi:antitoxin HicB